MSLLIYIIVLFNLLWSVPPYLCFSLSKFLSLCLSSKQVYLGFYTTRIASLQGNHGNFSYRVEKQKQNKMKLENI